MRKHKRVEVIVSVNGECLESVELTSFALTDLEVATRCRLESAEENGDKASARRWKLLNAKLWKLREALGV